MAQNFLALKFFYHNGDACATCVCMESYYKALANRKYPPLWGKCSVSKVKFSMVAYTSLLNGRIMASYHVRL